MRRAIATLSVLALAGCTNLNTVVESGDPRPALRLVSYDSCEQLLPALRDAAKESVGPHGFNNMVVPLAFAARAEGALPPSQPDALTQGKDYSGTNTHTAGVDEPDLVKTDGRRIVTISGQDLVIVDVASRKVSHRLALGRHAHQLLLHGDRALVMSHGYPPQDGIAEQRSWFIRPYTTYTYLQLVDLSQARIISDYRIDASLVDARQVGETARVIVRNTPVIEFPQWKEGDTDGDRIKANQALIDKAPIEKWLPLFTTDGQTGSVGCGDVSRPDSFSGASMVTVLSFGLGAAALGNGDPVSVMADGNTVYGSGTNLYLAHDQRWLGWFGPNQRGTRRTDRTEVFQLDITAQRPVYVASGSFPGWVLNQYSLNEHDGVLRVATTSQAPWEDMSTSSSTVYTLRRDGGSLKIAGHVGGLGKGERIYSVRFVGPVGYVVTFRQTDPLYTIDLRDPAKPKVLGELKIPGYSAYLHPAGPDRLIGVGQDATDQGRTTGTQISLFNVGDLANPTRIAQHKIQGGHSMAEYDPHAFLYWPATKLLVVPVNMGALLIRVDEGKLTQLATVSHELADYRGQITRSLVIGESLWTVSEGGLLATDLNGASKQGWIAL
jgi:uncharacterized secreted protein with C-terminal beta-propeller domain